MPNSPTHLTKADIEAYYPRLRSVARRLLRDSADIADVVQTARERAWRFRHRFDATNAPGPWLTTTTKRTTVDLLRSRRADFVPLDETYPSNDATEARVVEREAAESLGTAIASLSPLSRDAILMHDVHGLSSREMATRKSLPYHTVRTHLFRARKTLRKRRPLRTRCITRIFLKRPVLAGAGCAKKRQPVRVNRYGIVRELLRARP